MMKLSDDSKAYQLYDEIRQIILSKNKNCSYKKEQCIDKRNIKEEIKNKYFSEQGKAQFENTDGDLVTIEISRWHNYKRWSRYGIDEVPSFKAEIYVGNKKVWSLCSYCKDSFNGEYSETEVSSLEIPKSILQEKTIEQTNEEKPGIQSREIKPCETRILFDEIANLHNKYKSAEQIKEELLLKRDCEIKEATSKIIKLYSEKINQNNQTIVSLKEELNNFDEQLAKYSTFDAEYIGKALQQLVSITEAEEFLYKNIKYSSLEIEYEDTEIYGVGFNTYAKMIISKSAFENHYGRGLCVSDNHLECEYDVKSLASESDIILLSLKTLLSKDTDDEKVTFYTVSDSGITCNASFGRFDYIKKFIDNIIQYRFENDIVDFTEKDIFLFMQKFILEHKDIIMENYGPRKKEKALSLRLDIS